MSKRDRLVAIVASIVLGLTLLVELVFLIALQKPIRFEPKIALLAAIAGLQLLDPRSRSGSIIVRGLTVLGAVALLNMLVTQ